MVQICMQELRLKTCCLLLFKQNMFKKKKKSKEVPKFLLKCFSLSCISEKISRNMKLLWQQLSCGDRIKKNTAQAGVGGEAEECLLEAY